MMRQFIELILIAIGRKDRFDTAPTEEEWEALAVTAHKQALVGVAFSAIERLPASQRPPREVILSLYMCVQRIERNNAKLNEASVRTVRNLRRDGFGACVLKGQGNAMLYPEHLRKRRMGGDVDVWVLPDGFESGRVDDAVSHVVKYVRRFSPGSEATYHHIDFPVMKDVAIEVHYRPAFLYTPYRNKRLQRWFLENAERQFQNTRSNEFGEMAVPTREFNIVFQLCHIYKHFFEEGVGLRQLMDYYYVLMSTPVDANCQRDAVSIIRRSGMSRFARAVMWVLHEVFGMESEYMYVEADAKAGRLLLGEIDLRGNFGHMDTRFGDKSKETSIHRMLRVVCYDMRFFSCFPEEVLWIPFFKIRHWFWRRRMNRAK